MSASRKLRGNAVLLSVVLIAACSGSAPSDDQSASPALSPGSTATPTPTAVPAATTTPARTGELFALSGRDSSLWTLGDNGNWSRIRTIDGASALVSSSGGIAVASSTTVHILAATDPSVDARAVQLEWPGSPGRVASLDVSDDGRFAMAVGVPGSASYAVASTDGAIPALEPPSSQPFAPLVAWLDGGRRLVLTTDVEQVSRLSILDAAGLDTPLPGLRGCRWFGVSGDRKTIVAATDSAVYVGSTASWLAGDAPKKVVDVPDGSVVWGLALNRDGGKVAFFEGRVADDGAVQDVHERILEGDSAGWGLVSDTAVPFQDPVGQAWAS